MSSGLPMWGNQKVEKFTTDTSPPPTGGSTVSNASQINVNASQLTQARDVASAQVAGILETAQNLQQTLNDMDVTKLLDSIRSVKGGMEGILAQIALLRSELASCCSTVSAISESQATVVGKLSALEMAHGANSSVWLNNLEFGLSAAAVILLLVVIFMLSKGTCRR